MTTEAQPVETDAGCEASEYSAVLACPFCGGKYDHINDVVQHSDICALRHCTLLDEIPPAEWNTCAHHQELIDAASDVVNHCGAEGHIDAQNPAIGKLLNILTDMKGL